MNRWTNKVAVVTGASSGIGSACCRNLLGKGMIVVGLARRLDRLQELRDSLVADEKEHFHVRRCDVTVEADIIDVFKWIEQQWGGTNVLVNNAGLVHFTSILADNNTAEMRSLIDTNIMGVTLCTREAFRSMQARGGEDSHVIIINSISGHSVPNTGMNFNIYPATKFAVTAITEILRREFQQLGPKAKVTSISPGAVDTEIFADKTNLPADFSFLQAEDIADAVAYCIDTPSNVQVHEMIIKPMGEKF